MRNIKFYLLGLFFICFCYIGRCDAIFSDYPNLKKFGDDFFENYSLDKIKSQILISDDYILGPGDEIIISVWGFFEQEFKKEIEMDGSIFISGIGKIYLGGRKLKDARKIIEDRFYKKYKKIQVSVSTGRIRNINIFVLGEVKRPGVYEITPFYSILDIIAVAGGISKTGSLRKIEIKRADSSNKFVDLYPLLLKGEKLEFFQFQDRDVIFIHPANNYVGIDGAVKKPGIYELENMELKEIIELAGGFLPNADLSHIQVERIDKAKGKIIIDIDEKEMGSFILKNFDVVKVPFMSNQIYYQVTVIGAVKTNRTFGWKENLKLSDILKKEDLSPLADISKGEIIRNENGFTKVISFSPEKVFKGEENIELMPLDKIIIFSKERPIKKVIVLGEVKYPGEYIIESGEKLSSLIKRAGGFTSSAYPKGIVFLRESIKELKEKEIEGFVQEKREILTSLLKSSFNSEEKEIIEKGLISLEKVSEAKLTGRVIVKLDSWNDFEKTKYDIILENNDVIYVPKKPLYVSIIGEVRNPTNVFYEENLRTIDYINRAGGFTRNSDVKNIYIIRIDGSTDTNLEKIEPGDTIVVPFEAKDRTGKIVKDIMQILYQITVGIGVLIK